MEHGASPGGDEACGCVGGEDICAVHKESEEGGEGGYICGGGNVIGACVEFENGPSCGNVLSAFVYP